MKYFCLLTFFFFIQNAVVKAQQNAEVAKPDTSTIYSTNDVEVKPSHPGGINELLNLISENNKFMFVATKAGVSGKILVSFIVETDGTLSNYKIIQDLGNGSGQELIKLLKKTKPWSPGVKNNEKVRVNFVLPVTIRSAKEPLNRGL